MQNSAFTLVELAIVIVIIGLLVGGVLQGQELIAQAKVRRTIAEMDSFDASILTFRAKYNALPGDMRNATSIWGEVSADCTSEIGTGTQTCNGNGNMHIDYETGPGLPVHEGLRVWQHLSNANLIKGSFTGGHGGSTGVLKYRPDINSPRTQYNGGWAVWYSTGTAVPQWSLRRGHFYSFVYSTGNRRAAGVSAGSWIQYSMTAEQLMTLDVKIDDGKPWRGLVTNMGLTYTENCATAASTDDLNADYDLTRNTLECVPMLPSKVM